MPCLSRDTIEVRNRLETLLLAWGFSPSEDIEENLELEVVEGSEEGFITNEQCQEMARIASSSPLGISCLLLVRVSKAEVAGMWENALKSLNRTATVFGDEEDALVVGVDEGRLKMEELEALLAAMAASGARYDPIFYIPLQ